jgi:hypothetical protein
MVHSFEMAPIDSKSPAESVRRPPSRSRSTLTNDRAVMSRMGATQELKVGVRWRGAIVAAALY